MPAPAQSFPLRLHREGTLTVRDAKRHIPHVLTVPEGATQLTLHFACTPAVAHGLDNMLTLTLFDPHGFRGARHRDGARHDVVISSHSATPGYLPGPLPAGDWIVQIDAHRILPGAPLHYTLAVEIGADDTLAQASVTPQGRPGAVVRKGAGWYRGDLHSHTSHSDAGERTVIDLVAAARAVGLDFLFLTDHNTISPLAESDALASPDLLTAGGMELTTFWGHALVLGTRQWIDWRFRPGDGVINQLAEAVYGRGELFVIAHPGSEGDPGCTGCAWRFGEMMPGAARIVEIWNGPWAGDSNNALALALYYDWLNQGRRLVATAGSDTHSTADYFAGPGFNVVYAEELSEAALLRAIAAGHLYLSSGPRLTLTAVEQDGVHRMMGDTVMQAATVAIQWAQCPPGARLCVLANGLSLHQQPVDASGSFVCELTSLDANWLIAEVRAEDGGLLAITNPLFLA
ncbi:MAG TPA: phosphotransferase [Chloroflexi bacterium]|nr:phosphotransferase [Chloroflexota bacterium]HHW88002.1 CehA/McbA family metallohydrolase [Chloroflexota bacterium]